MLQFKLSLAKKIAWKEIYALRINTVNNIFVELHDVRSFLEDTYILYVEYMRNK